MIHIGIDVSRYQGEMDFLKAKSAGAKFVFVRCTVGDYYTDPAFYANYNGARDAGLPVGLYHVVADRDGVGRVISAAQQMDYLFGQLPIGGFDFPIVLDCEINRGSSPAEMSRLIQDCIAIIRGRLFRYPIIYTRAGWWNPNVTRSDNWQNCPLWVANYTTGAEPIMPLDWDSWVFWQYSADGNGLGSYYGAQSNSIDLNRFDTVTGAQYGITIPDQPGGNIPAWVITTAAVNVRQGPGTEFAVKALTKSLTTWRVLGATNDAQGRAWYQIAEQAYLAGWYCRAVEA